MRWNVELEQCLVAIAPFGGPIAITRNPGVLVKATKPSKPAIGVYTSSGLLISQFTQQGSSIHSMDWTQEEYLVTLFTDGTIFSSDIHGNLRGYESLAVQAEVLLASYHPRGVVVLLSNMQLLHVAYRMGGEKKIWNVSVLANLGFKEKPLCIQVVPPRDDYDDTSSVQVLVSPDPVDSPQGTLYLYDETQKIDLGTQTTLSHVYKLAINPKGTQVATFSEGGYVNIVDINMKKYYAKFGTKSQEAPRQLLWCGNDVVVCVWRPDQLNCPDSIVLIIAPGQEHTSIKHEGDIHVIGEIDCMRLVMNTECGLFGKVPSCTRDTFTFDPEIPDTDVTVLLDAFRDFEKQRASSVKSIRQLSGKLENAVNGCIDVASCEWEPEQQQFLLKAAHYGKSFCKGYDSDKYVDTCKSLRVLNAVRSADVGMPLTWDQYQYLSSQVVIDRLINRKLYHLAYKMSTYLDSPANQIKKILVHWAYEKVQAKLTDDEIVKCIREKFKECPGISYKDVAERAWKLRPPKTSLAIKLLEKEPKAALQVSLLIDMQEPEMALQKAVESGDTDLVYLVMLRLKRDVKDDALIRTLSNKPVARDLFLSYCEHLDPRLLRKYYATEQLHHQTAFQAIRDYFTEPDDHKKPFHLQEAKDNFAKRKDRTVEKDLILEQEKLLKKQEEYAKKLNEPRFTAMQMGVAATMKMLFKLKAFKEADKMKSEFGISDKMFTWVKLKALSKYGHWSELESWINKLGKKCPIGFRPIFDEAVKYDRTTMARAFVTKIEDYAERCEAMCTIGMFQEAIKVAETERDVGILEAIRGKAPADMKGMVNDAIHRVG
eukprot:TRINITY_DN2611_c0_g1_i1.p1 TRINITY_DN2611_c0_g1~~TRINITY_DN2611_c0_g1_i1.p1  ORF type:complete len:858 (+),score=197.19 TRINITY_DN2611_c0_g1_i1:101-2575(+)